MLGEDGAYVLVNGQRVVKLNPDQIVHYSRAVQFEPETLQKISEVDLGVPQPDPQHVQLKFALAGGGVYAVGPTSAYAVNASADASAFAGGGNATSVLSDLWAGWNSSAPALALGGNVKLAATVWPRANGTDKAGQRCQTYFDGNLL